MGFIDRARQAIGSAKPPVDVVTPHSRPVAAFMRGGRAVAALAGFRPALREAQEDVGSAWDDAAARSIDLIQNSGWISGAIDQAVADTVGTGLRLRAAPENELFGASEDAAAEWSNRVEQRFELWANRPLECDVEGRRTFGQMQASGLRSYFGTGETLAELVWRKRSFNTFGTKVRMLPPTRLLRKTDKSRRIVQGVRMDADGLPIGYIAGRDDPLLGLVEVEATARDAFGRPNVIHIFDGLPGQVRGISPLTPALMVARQFDQLSDATLTSALVQNVFAATLTSDGPTEEIVEGLLSPQELARVKAEGMSAFDAWVDASAGWYDNVAIDLGIKGRLAHLFPGQKLEFTSPTIPTGAYKEFSMHLLREIMRCIGVTFESGTGDYTGATYSSVRMAVNSIFAVTVYRRMFIVVPFCQAVYEAWLEEEIETGRIPFPGGIVGFMQNRAAACRANWRGTPKPQADDLKTAKALEIYDRLGVVSDEMIANDLGVDIEDVYAQRAREQKRREHYGLPEKAPAVAVPSGADPDDDEEK